MQRPARAATQEIMAQFDNAAARVQDDGLRANLNFNTACVAPVAYRARPRSRVAAAHSPEARPETRCFICHAVFAPATAQWNVERLLDIISRNVKVEQEEIMLAFWL